MTLPTDAVSEQVFIGAGSGSALSLNFKFLGTDDLVVTRIVDGVEDEDPLVRGVDYTVAGGNGGTGTVTPATAIPVGTSWRVRRDTPIGQPAAFQSGSYLPGQHETALDRQAMVSQELQRELDRAVLAPRGETPPSVQELLDMIGVLMGLQGPFYDDTASGLAETPEGDEFTVINANKTATVFRKVSGAAVEVRRLIIDPSAPVAASLIGTPDGTLQAVLDDFRARIEALEA